MQHRLQELAALTAAQLIGDPELIVEGINTLDDAGPSDISFLANPLYTEAMKQSKAGAVCVRPDVEVPAGKSALISENPSATFQKIAELLLPPDRGSGFTGIHPSAVIHPSVKLGDGVTVGPNTVIDRDTVIGANSVIGPNVSISHEVHIGSDCRLHANTVVRERCKLGNRVILQPGAVIGSCGFGYTLDKQGRHVKLEQLGIVVLEDDVEIGANTTVDRSRFKTTRIRQGTKLDNLCQIGHNVEVGEHNIIAAQTGMAGSSKTGKYVMMGGQVGVLGHTEIDDEVHIATRSGVSKRLKKGKYRGSPAMPIGDYHRQEVHVRKLEEYVERLKALEKKLSNI